MRSVVRVHLSPPAQSLRRLYAELGDCETVAKRLAMRFEKTHSKQSPQTRREIRQTARKREEKGRAKVAILNHSSLLRLHSKHGGVAQLGEHLPCKQGVDSSILFISTSGAESALTIREIGF